MAKAKNILATNQIIEVIPRKTPEKIDAIALPGYLVVIQFQYNQTGLFYPFRVILKDAGLRSFNIQLHQQKFTHFVLLHQ